MNCFSPTFRILAASGLLLLARPAAAQNPQPAPMPEQVYTFVEQMPQLPGGGGNLAIVTHIQRQVRYPIQAMRARAEGRVFVSFTVAASGLVEDVAVAKGFRRDCDSAVVEAVKTLPRFEPGRQVGRAVPVRFTMPVTFKLTTPQTVMYDSIRQVYYNAEQMPAYKGKKGLVHDLLQEFQAAGTAAGCAVPKFPVLVSLTVGPTGNVYDVKSRNNLPLISQEEAIAGKVGIVAVQRTLQELPAACETALVTAAQHLAPFTPGSQNGRNVAVSFTIQLIGAGK